MELAPLLLAHLGQRRVADHLLDAAAQLRARHWRRLDRAGYWAGDVAGERGDCDALVRGGYWQAAAARRDAEKVCHPKVEWTVPEDGTTYRGREGVSQRLKEWLESFDDYRYEVQRVIDCGGNEVLVEATEVGRGVASGAEVRSTNYELLTIRDGMIVRIREFYDTGDALEAAGLRE